MHISIGLTQGQVLQRLGARGATVKISGTTTESGPVFATIRTTRGIVKKWKKRKVGRAQNGKFATRLEGIPAGGPYHLELQAGKTVARVKSFFVGDVWLLSGQSNMEGVGKRTGASKPHPLIRTFSMRREWREAAEPLHVVGESPDACHTLRPFTPREAEAYRRETIKGTGVGLYFAHEMLKRSKVPQGLICTAHGGTSMEQWNPARKREKGNSLYGSMLLSVEATGQPMAGVLWYQGESDATPPYAPLYTGRMKQFVRASRRDLRQPSLPWMVVQIARVYGASRHVNQREMCAWNQIQEEQRLLPTRIPHLETVSAIDLPLDDNIHIGAAGFPRLAARLARMADRLVHHNRREKGAPRVKSIGAPHFSREDGCFVIDVTFDDVVGGLRSFGEPGGFAITDGKGRDLHALFKVTLHQNTVRLHLGVNPLPPNSWLSYGFGTETICPLTDGRDMALPVFGPMNLSPPTAHLPFVTTWRKTGILSGTKPLAKLDISEIEGPGTEVKTYIGQALEGWVNEHAAWERNSGQVYFAARIELPEPMRLEVLAGYDGPFRLWIGRQPFFDAIDGTNPCQPDKGKKKISLPAGPHDLHVAMDLADGLSWGFFLRFRRLDVTRRQITDETYAKPVYSA